MPLLRSKVKSRKFVRCLLVSAAIFSPRLSNTAVISFLSLSKSLPDRVLITASRAVARALIGGLNIHIFVLCPTNFF